MFLRGVLLGQRISSIATAAKNSRGNRRYSQGRASVTRGTVSSLTFAGAVVTDKASGDKLSRT
ncbi:MAG TPA: hypothetical protein PLO08_15965, partial [Alicycliphilus sp.]|nr:hypothetical protein [Alicycliphilus sp.]